MFPQEHYPKVARIITPRQNAPMRETPRNITQTFITRNIHNLLASLTILSSRMRVTTLASPDTHIHRLVIKR